ncbi:DNA-directed RNA polymerase III complex subunit Rpc25 [Diaporthe eres]|uniref:DNA-directed RNA polymerase subunit n=1 Tax=Diaporthe eres TaxID=83184 RepID=A0ABR1P2G2_DIAER
MFILTKIADLVQITPEDFHKKSSDAIEDNINAKYANKAGLMLSFDLVTDALTVTTAEFRLVVFRPFKGEVIMAKISKCTPEGIHVRTEFFSDIFVEAEELPDGCQFDHNEQLWVWNNDETGPMWWDVHETVRVAVVGEEWHDQTPTKPTVAPGEDQPEEQRKPPYVIKGSMKNPGLGCTLWWEF